MKIEEKGLCSFKELKGGDIFEFERGIYIKRKGTNIAVECRNGGHFSFHDAAPITYLPNAVLHINR